MPHRPLPETCAIAFKEWAGVCRALGSGRQALVVRKGGVSEGPGGFTPDHATFWLWPTTLHQDEQGLKPWARAVAATRGESDDSALVPLGVLLEVESVRLVTDLDRLLSLDDLHAWTEATIRKRFAYRAPTAGLTPARTEAEALADRNTLAARLGESPAIA
jgi:hypothetical protein